MMAKGLGKGMGALLGDEALSDGQSSVTRLPLEKIEPRRGQPRVRFDPEKLEELAESIREHGMIQPITVRQLDSGYYQIIAGERRWRAARKARLTEVPVNIIEADDRETEELALIENLQREDLNPMEEARGYRQMMNKFGLTQEQVADRVGKSRPVVANALRLLKLSETAVVLIESGKLSLSHARAILEVEDPEKQTELALRVVDEGLSVRQTTQLAKGASKKPRGGSAARNPRLGADGIDYMREVEEELSKVLSTKVKIDSRSDSGTIKIEYYSRNEFEQLYKALRETKRG